MRIISLFIVLILWVVTTYSCSNVSKVDANNQQSKMANKDKIIIVDVRTVEEWNNDGHANCSVNYPLDELSNKVEMLKSYPKVIVVCRSGNRANAAKNLLEQNGVKVVENLGAWQNINCK